MKAFLSELKRRNVFRVAAAYAVTAWLLIEIASVLLSNSEARLPMMMGLVILLAIGFALAVFISWTFEATPDGLKRTANVPAGEILPSWSPRKFAVFIVLVAALAASLFLYDVVRSRPRKAATPPTTTP